MMLNYEITKEGNLVVWLHRCNDFGDHKELGMDGSLSLGRIDMVVRYKDAADAMYLIDKINERLDTVAKPSY